MCIAPAGFALVLSATLSHAVGLDRSGQSVGIIFKDGNYVELSFGYVNPTIDGKSVTSATSQISNVASNYSQLGLGLKTDVSEQLSFALIVDEPYGADIEYPSDAAAPLGNTAANLDSWAITGMARYKIDESFSMHGGLRTQHISGNVVLPGAGTTVELEQSSAVGYAIGGAYERSDIALRVALTYFSEVEHEFDTTTGGAFQEVLTVKTPQAVNLDFQTGLNEDTLLFGSVRWAEYSVVDVTPTPVGSSIVNVEDGFTYSLGLGRRFSEKFSGSLSATLGTPGEDDLVSPLGPRNGSQSIGIGGQYRINENLTLSSGARYIVFGDARPELDTPTTDTPYAELKDNSAIAVGFKIGYSF